MATTPLSRHRTALAQLFTLLHELKADPVGRAHLSPAIQEELIVLLSRAENRVRSLRAQAAALRVALAQPGGGRQQSRSLKAAIADNEDKIDATYDLMSVLRDIGDGIAFIYASRWDIKPMVFRQSSGFITQKRGARLERRCLRQSWRWGANSLLNDLTHSLRYGDIAVFQGGLMHLFEVKSGNGGNRDRARRQAAALDKLMTYLRSDHSVGLYEDGVEMMRVETRSEPRYHEGALNDLIARLGTNDCGSVEVEPGLHYLATRGHPSDEAVEGMFRSLRLEEVAVFHTNSYKYAAEGYYPFTLSFHDPERLFEFYQGDLAITVLLDTSVIRRALLPLGIELIATSDERFPMEFRADAENCMRASQHFLGRIGAEFLSGGWLVEHVIDVLSGRAELPPIGGRDAALEDQSGD